VLPDSARERDRADRPEARIPKIFHRQPVGRIERECALEKWARRRGIAFDAIDAVLDLRPDVYTILGIDGARRRRRCRGAGHVPEGAQPLRRFSSQGLRGWHVLRRRRQRALQSGGERATRVDAVQPLGGIVLKVVELGTRRLDVLPSARANGPQRAPAEQHVLIVGLGVRRSIGIAGGSSDQRQQTLSVDGRKTGACHRGDRRREIGGFDRRLDDVRGCRRPLHQERDVDRRVVQKRAMGPLAVFAERLTVIGHDDRGGGLEQAAPLELFEEPAERRVGVGDLSIVGRRGVLRRKWRRRRIRRVRVEQVQPDEHRLRAVAVDPRRRGVHDLVRTTLNDGGLLEKIIVVAVEASGQTRRCPQWVAADECAGCVPASLQGRRRACAHPPAEIRRWCESRGARDADR
jgi:hypothetical protein